MLTKENVQVILSIHFYSLYFYYHYNVLKQWYNYFNDSLTLIECQKSLLGRLITISLELILLFHNYTFVCLKY